MTEGSIHSQRTYMSQSYSTRQSRENHSAQSGPIRSGNPVRSASILAISAHARGPAVDRGQQSLHPRCRSTCAARTERDAVIEKIKAQLLQEKDRNVAEDLQILIHSIDPTSL